MSNILYIMVGPPCSGKTTLAKILAQERSTLRINRDELRSMLKGKYVVGDRLTEACVTSMVKRFILNCCQGNVDCIIDATHCKVKTINSIKSAVPLDSNTKVQYIICDEPLWKLNVRNVWRWINTGFKIWIPFKVIKDMHQQFQEVKDKINNNGI